MIYEDLLAVYKSGYRVFMTFGLNHGTPYVWKKNGFIPIRSQQMIELKTKGKFKADLNHTTRQGCLDAIRQRAM